MFYEIFESFCRVLPDGKTVCVWKPLNVFGYISFRTAAAMTTALLLTLLAYPRFIRWLRHRKFGQEIRDDGPQSHLAKQGTPTMG
ncbi:MAG: hypothetical protein VX498_00250, partial [Myxococcota bacterium]|nr:hypothetical protein [Myxococcota bacterium]